MKKEKRKSHYTLVSYLDGILSWSCYFCSRFFYLYHTGKFADAEKSLDLLQLVPPAGAGYEEKER